MHEQWLIGLFGSDVRYQVLRQLSLLSEPASATDISKAAAVDFAGVHRLLSQLCKSGVVLRTGSTRRWLYQLTTDPDLIRPLRWLLDPIENLAIRLREQFRYDPDIEAALIFGSFARGEAKPSSDVDVLVIGDVSSLRLNADLASLGSEIGRPINASVYKKDRFEQLQAEGNSFASSVLLGKTIELKGQIHGSTENPEGS